MPNTSEAKTPWCDIRTKKVSIAAGIIPTLQVLPCDDGSGAGEED